MPTPTLEFRSAEDRYPEASAVATTIVHLLLARCSLVEAKEICGRAHNLLSVAYYKQTHGEGH
jgi:hypothetical protein